MIQPPALDRYERRIRGRHGYLASRKLLRGLSQVEAAERTAINQALDAIEEPWYRPIKEKLRRIEQEILARQEAERVPVPDDDTIPF